MATAIFLGLLTLSSTIFSVRRNGDGNGPMGPLGIEGPVGLRGPIGPTGPEGLKGPTGPAGANGRNGRNGAVGPTGHRGPQGPNGFDGPDGLVGRMGPTGPTGPIGLTGQEGLPGDEIINPEFDPGDTGDQGPTGPPGLPGPVGATGPTQTTTGPAGPTGPTGPSSLSTIYSSFSYSLGAYSFVLDTNQFSIVDLGTKIQLIAQDDGGSYLINCRLSSTTTASVIINYYDEPLVNYTAGTFNIETFSCLVELYKPSDDEGDKLFIQTSGTLLGLDITRLGPLELCPKNSDPAYENVVQGISTRQLRPGDAPYNNGFCEGDPQTWTSPFSVRDAPLEQIGSTTILKNSGNIIPGGFQNYKPLIYDTRFLMIPPKKPFTFIMAFSADDSVALVRLADLSLSTPGPKTILLNRWAVAPGPPYGGPFIFSWPITLDDCFTEFSLITTNANNDFYNLSMFCIDVPEGFDPDGPAPWNYEAPNNQNYLLCVNALEQQKEVFQYCYVYDGIN